MLLINNIVPIFLLILIGYGFAHFKKEEAKATASGLMQYIFWIAAPVLIFSSISAYQMHQLLAWRFAFAYVLSIILVFLLTYTLLRLAFKESRIGAAIAAVSSSNHNTVIIGFPILLSILGAEAAIPMVITVMIFYCITAPLLILVCELHASRHLEHKSKILIIACKNILKNPLILATLAGMIVSISEMSLPSFAKDTFNAISASFVPSALFAVGIELRSFKFENNMAKTLSVTCFNLIIAPIIAIGLASLLKLPAFYAIALVIFTAMPTPKVMYVYVNKYKIFSQETAAIISLTTVFSLITIPLIIYVCYGLWHAVFQHLST